MVTLLGCNELTHWGRVTHICVSRLPTIGSDNGLSPGRRQAIIWTNAGILLIGPLWTNFSEILIDIPTFSFKKMHLKMSSAKWRPCCLGLNVLSTTTSTPYQYYACLEPIQLSDYLFSNNQLLKTHILWLYCDSVWLWRDYWHTHISTDKK